MASTDGIDSRWLDANGAEPIAIIGSACRFSGTASNQDGLWQMLSSGRTSWASNARNRFKMESFWHPQAHLPGSVSQRLHSQKCTEKRMGREEKALLSFPLLLLFTALPLSLPCIGI
ncbi:hypothetical protein V8C35DRAFT_303034 [Trichoderma chlorosporum]